MTPGRQARPAARFIAAALALAMLAPFGVPSGARATESQAALSATAAPYALDLSQPPDFVAQTNFVQCVGASMQMMLNMVRAEDDRSAATQARLQDLARTFSGRRPDGSTRQGASVIGWSAGLNLLGAGPYRVVGSETIDGAMRLAARAIRETGRPVGLLVWRGRHAWVMSGFEATADPLATDDFAVTRAVVLDPLYPHGSRQWGPSPKPRASIDLETLGRQFVPRRTGSSASRWLAGFGGMYVLVMPYTPFEIARFRSVAV